MRRDLYERALQLDDGMPLHVCPGCGRDLSDMPRGADHMTPAQWDEHARLYGNKLGEPWNRRAASPFVFATNGVAERCEWTADMLVARSWRRKWIAEYAASEVAV